jgi:spoIIIJ-associated protein
VQRRREADHARRDDELIAMAHDAAAHVERSGRPRRLPPMNAYERRLVHLTIREYDGLDSRSEGHGHLKRVRVVRRSD